MLNKIMGLQYLGINYWLEQPEDIISVSNLLLNPKLLIVFSHPVKEKILLQKILATIPVAKSDITAIVGHNLAFLNKLHCRNVLCFAYGDSVLEFPQNFPVLVTHHPDLLVVKPHLKREVYQVLLQLKNSLIC